ncbi:TrbC/VirB2 family protein [Listeria innocua]|uniref:TrbC/VirB2 family protein n=1 Tax=Listeria innocua TaxID=1642 RepID=UPI0012F35D39|nr:TrbC/VirB2 family protein [Listeria innocua]ECB9830354.1 TrbC/VirB2 family protein [Listeria monocytogenes]MBC1353677.1 TrbC/VirB2 family protein [Listeria innocua]
MEEKETFKDRTISPTAKKSMKDRTFEKPTMMKIMGAFFSACLFLFAPTQAFAAKTSGDIQSSINSASEGVYDFVTGITFWLGVVMIALGFVVMKFKWLDRSGTAGKIILNAIFGIGGVFAAPQIAQFVIDLVA